MASSTRKLARFKRGGGVGEASAAATGRLHGLPLEVIPRHVVEGFLESDRLMSDSGVLAKNGIANHGRRTEVECEGGNRQQPAISPRRMHISP